MNPWRNISFVPATNRFAVTILVNKFNHLISSHPTLFEAVIARDRYEARSAEQVTQEEVAA
jgi:hypothetical protein